MTKLKTPVLTPGKQKHTPLLEKTYMAGNPTHVTLTVESGEATVHVQDICGWLVQIFLDLAWTFKDEIWSVFIVSFTYIQ